VASKILLPLRNSTTTQEIGTTVNAKSTHVKHQNDTFILLSKVAARDTVLIGMVGEGLVLLCVGVVIVVLLGMVACWVGAIVTYFFHCSWHEAWVKPLHRVRNADA